MKYIYAQKKHICSDSKIHYENVKMRQYFQSCPNFLSCVSKAIGFLGGIIFFNWSDDTASED